MKTNADAEAVLTAAKKQAKKFHGNFVNTEHLLYGILFSSECAAMILLRKMGMEPAQALNQMEARTSSEVIVTKECGQLPLSVATKKIMGLAAKEAIDLGHSEITSTHILLGILRHDDSRAAEVLHEYNVHLQLVRTFVWLSVTTINVPNKPAKDFIHEFSEIGRHNDYGNRHSFMSLIFAGVNVSASLNYLQQNLCRKRMSEAWSEVREKSEGDKVKEAMNIADFINGCHP